MGKNGSLYNFNESSPINGTLVLCYIEGRSS